MARFNSTSTVKARTPRTPIRSAQTPTEVTHQGGKGFSRDTKSELFLLAITNFVGQNTFYESAEKRDERFAELVRKVAAEDPEWLIGFGGWLRRDANMRTASLIVAAEAIKSGVHGFRSLVSSVLLRADEPGELIGYWHQQYGKNLPKPLKRGIADAAARMYTERNTIKYDTASHAVRFADVLRLCHVKPGASYQTSLFPYLIGQRIGVENVEIPDNLSMIRSHAALRTLPPEKARTVLTETSDLGTPAELLAGAGMTWEQVPSLVNGPWTRELWEAMIPSMGYMALLRNLRNFDAAGISKTMADQVCAKLADADEVKRSRQLPMRFLSAYKAAPSLRWGYALETALDLSLRNIPVLSGNTLILVDTSGSMHSGFSKDGTLMRWDAAAMFGLALARRCEKADVVSFSDGGYGYYARRHASGVMPWTPVKGESLLKSLDRWKNGGYFMGGGTDTVGAVKKSFNKHDRVVILTDEQVGYYGGYGYGRDETPDTAVPADVPLHTWNLAGYRVGQAPEKNNRYTYGGLSDAGFTLMGLVESAGKADWPWLNQQ